MATERVGNLIQKHTNGIIYEENAGVLTPLNTSLGSLSALDLHHHKNGVIRYANKVYFVWQHDLYVYDPSDDSTTKIHNATPASSFSGSGYTGIFPVLKSGSARLVYLQMSTDTAIKVISYNPATDTVTASSNITASSPSVATGSCGLTPAPEHKGIIYILVKDSSGVSAMWAVDISGETLAKYSIDNPGPAKEFTGCSVIEWKGDLYIVYNSDTLGVNSWVLLRFNGSGFTTEATFATITGGLPGGYGINIEVGLFVDPGEDQLIAIVPGTYSGANARYYAYKFTGSPGSITATDISSSILPTALTNTQDLSNVHMVCQ